MSKKEAGFAPTAIVIFAIALAVRLLHVWQIRSAPFFSLLMGDSRGYDEWAQRLAAGDWIGHDVFYQAPLYPYFLGVVYAMAGRNLLLVRIVQALIGASSCVLLARAAGRLFSPRAGVVSGAILALYAPAIFFDGLLQKTVLDVFFVCLALWIISRLRARSSLEPPASLRGWLALGMTMGALSLTRENALVLVVVIVAWALVTIRRGAVLFLLGLAIVIAPVVARNSVVGGGFYVTTSQMGPNLYIGNNPRADGTYASLRYGRGAPEYERQDATELAEHALGRHLTPAEVSSYWTDRALDFVTGQPIAWLGLTARKVALLLNRTEVVDTEDQATYADWSTPLRILGPIANVGVLVPLAVLGILATWPRRRELWVLYALMLAYAASVVAFYVFARYRFPLVPFLVMFAAAGVTTVTRVARTGRTVAAIVVTAVVANWPLLSTDDMRAVTENNLGVALQGERRYGEAQSHYERAIARRPDYAPAYSNLGTVLRAQGRIPDAVRSYERAIRLQPDYPDAQYNLANALLDAGQSDAAIEHFETALRAAPASAETHNNLAIALAANGRTDAARAEFEAALQIDPGSAKAHRNLGDLLASAGRTGDALEHLRRATELAPGEGALHYDLGSVLLEAGRPTEAAVEFRAALKTMPQSVEAHNNLGIALGSIGELDEAIGEFEAALKIRPEFEDAHRNLAMARAAKQGPPSRATSALPSPRR